MRSSLTPRIRELLSETEDSLRTSIEISEDAALSVAGTTAVIHARPNYGRIVLSPRYADCASYVVANQCGHILRYMRAPPDHRLVPAESPQAYSFIHREVDQHARTSELLRRLRPAAISELARMLTTGLITQLTSMPVDCRIDRWLYRELEELRDEQGRAPTKMLAAYAGALRTADWTPALIYNASNGMNAAFASNAENLFPECDRYTRRYEREGFGGFARRLIAHLEGEDEGHVSDIKTIDAWATELALRELYTSGRHEAEMGRE